MKIKREQKLSNLDLFAGYVAYIKKIKELKTNEGNKVENNVYVEFPDHLGHNINKVV